MLRLGCGRSVAATGCGSKPALRVDHAEPPSAAERPRGGLEASVWLAAGASRAPLLRRRWAALGGRLPPGPASGGSATLTLACAPGLKLQRPPPPSSGLLHRGRRAASVGAALLLLLGQPSRGGVLSLAARCLARSFVADVREGVRVTVRVTGQLCAAWRRDAACKGARSVVAPWGCRW
jgi:hypothetical protein